MNGGKYRRLCHSGSVSHSGKSSVHIFFSLRHPGYSFRRSVVSLGWLGKMLWYFLDFCFITSSSHRPKAAVSGRARGALHTGGKSHNHRRV